MTSNLTISAAIRAKALPHFKLQNILLVVSTFCIASVFYVTRAKEDASFSSETAFENGSSSGQPYNAPAATNGTFGVQATQTVGDVVTKALTFYGLLNTAQKASLQLTYSNSLARKWSNLPCGTSCRNGLQLGTNLTAVQYAAATELIKTALGTGTNEGADEYRKLNLAEAYLHANGGGNSYDSTLRWIAFLNPPTATGAWMLQVGGHHYAANIAFNNGHVIGATPFFTALEPKTFTYNSVAYDPLGQERDAFRVLFGSLSAAQLTAAQSSSSFSDCVMVPGESNGGTATFPAATQGQSVGSLTAAQQNLVIAVLQTYVGDIDAATAAYMLNNYTTDLASTYILFRGSGTVGTPSTFLTTQGDYMRIAGPNVWIEFSCQRGIVIQGQIHYHSIWRDRSHDYGVDLTGASIDEAVVSTENTSVSPKQLTVFPNPVASSFNLNLPEGVSNGEINLIDAAGKTVYSVEQFDGTNVTIDMNSFPQGHYFLTVKDRTHYYTSKIVKL